MLSRADLEIYQGDDYRARVQVVDAATPPDQILAGHTARAQIRSGPADTAPAVVMEMSAQVNSPYVDLTIPHDDTTTMTPGNYVWDLEVVDGNGLVTTILAGHAVVIPEVTR